MTTFDGLWGRPPADLALSDDGVHVWRAPLHQPASCVERWRHSLTPDELQRAARFYFKRNCVEFTVGRGLLRAILSRYLDAEPGQLRFRYGPHGKPALSAPASAGAISFNVSQSDGFVLYAITRGRAIGVDIERIRKSIAYMEIASHFFAPGENEMLRALPVDQRLIAFFTCWTRKEAYLKARGEGLSLPLDQFEVSLAPGEPADLLRVGGESPETARWSIQELMAGPEYVAALAVEGPIGRLTCWEYPGATGEGKVPMAQGH